MSIDIPQRVAERAYFRFVASMDGCRISSYSVASHGYAQIGWTIDNTGRRSGTTAHRAAWVYVHGQIPDGMTIDHVCKNRRCVNVDHMRMLTNYENARRTDGRDWPLGECANGHPNSENIDVNGKHHCRICHAEWKQRGVAKTREKRRRQKLAG